MTNPHKRRPRSPAGDDYGTLKNEASATPGLAESRCSQGRSEAAQVLVVYDPQANGWAFGATDYATGICKGLKHATAVVSAELQREIFLLTVTK
jgi:hypothetical protein